MSMLDKLKNKFEPIYEDGGPFVDEDAGGIPPRSDQTKERGNPYLSARLEYEDRYGAAVKTSSIWRRISAMMTILCVLFGGCMIWLASQNKVIPYIVQIDRHGYAVAIKSAQEGAAVDQRVVIATIGRIMMDMRTVIQDTRAQKRLIDSVYACIARDSPAEVKISTFYKDNNPYAFVKEKKLAKQVQIRSVAAFDGGAGKGTSWLVLWSEEITDGGRIVEVNQWRAIVQIAVSPVKELSAVLQNPLGIYITDITMTQDLI